MTAPSPSPSSPSRRTRSRAGEGIPKQYPVLLAKPCSRRIAKSPACRRRRKRCSEVFTADDARFTTPASRSFQPAAQTILPRHRGASRQASVRNGLEALQG